MAPDRVLVTGAGGFVGRAVVHACESRWPHARLLRVDVRALPAGIDVACDLREGEPTASMVRDFRPEVVFHMAGVTGGTDWRTLWETNVLPLANVLDAVAAESPNCRIVVPGSAAEYGEADESDGPLDEDSELRPSSPYGVSKVWQSVLARSYAAQPVSVVIGRVFNLTGRGVPPHFVVGAVAEQLRRVAAGQSAPVLHLGDLTAVRDFIDIDDACAALLTLAENGRAGETYNICSGSPRRVGDVVTELVRLSGTEATVVSETSAPDRGNVSWSVGNNAKILAETGWRPAVSLTKSLAAMLGTNSEL